MVSAANEQSAEWQARAVKIKADASRKMSEAKKGNDNAAKIKNNAATSCGAVDSGTSKRSKATEAKATASETNRRGEIPHVTATIDTLGLTRSPR